MPHTITITSKNISKFIKRAQKKIMEAREIKCKECNNKLCTLYLENGNFYCEKHCDYLKEDE